jgi:hypothetical protein
LSLFGINFIYAQPTEKLRFKKDSQWIYFFQKGNKTDTIQKNRGDIFYLLIPDSLKNVIAFMIDNAQLLPTENDSLVRLKHIRGIKYESFYYKVQGYKDNSINKNKYVLKNLVNGASETQKNDVKIQLIDKQKGELILETMFTFEPG